MLKRCFAALLVSSLASHVVAQNPPAITECLTDLSDILTNENMVTDTSIKRTYTLCPNTTFKTGKANQQTGQIEGGQHPIVTRANAHVKCGDNGKSSNNCKIDGTDYGIFQMPFQIFEDRPTDSSNVIFEGITMEFFFKDSQIPVLAAAHTGDVTFRDCVWSDNNADPLFLLSELGNGQRSSASGRSARLEEGPQVDGPAPGFINVWEPEGQNDPGRGRSLYDADSVTELMTPTVVNEKANVTVIGDRILQQTGLFKVTFEGCLFSFNDPVRNARSQSGLSLIRFTGSDTSGQGRMPERFGTIDGEFISNKFVGNIFDIDDDGASYRSIIDFFSEGKLTMKNNCFLNNTARGFGVVTVQSRASLINQDNYIEEKQSDLNCEFIARLDQLYNQKGCGTPAAANMCLATPPTAVVGFCFPGDATCQVEGQGQVLMKDLKLGDKVLVQGGKYEPVYSFGHHAQEVEALYLKFVTTAARSLELTTEHMVFIEGGRSVPASHVKVGDKLVLADGELATVRAVRLVQKQGAYAPFTASGTVIVNGVKASSFIAFQDSETLQVAGIDTGLTFQFLAYNFEMPHRMWCQYFSACIEEHYTTEGVSLWVDLPHKAALWYVDVNSPMVMTMTIGFLFLACIAMIANPVASLITLAAILVAIYRPGRFLHLKSAKSVHS